jgi:hypothetical protein
MIVVTFRGGRWVPLIYCDACGEEIHDRDGHRLPGALISPGAVIFSTRDEARSRVYYVHKERCFDQVKQAIGEVWAWEERVPHLIFLMHNIGFPVEELVLIDCMELEVDDRFSLD